MLPLVHGLDRLSLPGARHESLQIVPAQPSLMTHMLDQGELDIGMAPVGAMLERPEWRIVGRSMIGSSGPVRSVLAISRETPQAWRRLHPDSHSRTSNVLIQTLLAGRFGVRPELAEPIPMEGWEPPDRPAPGEAFVIIGTRAIRWRSLWQAEGGASLDMGEEWTAWTGLPFVFAVWVARRDARLDTAELAAWMEKFEALKRENLARLDAIIAQWPGLAEERQSPEEARDYLAKNIRFDLDDAALAGLDRFHAEAAKLGLFDGRWRRD